MLQNVHRIEGNVTYITLTRGQESVISTVDLERVLHVRWYAEYIRNNNNYRARGRFEDKPIFMHRYILNGITGPKDDAQVDHINFDTLDNRRENLRWVTASENCNHRRYKTGETGLLHIHLLRHPDERQYYYVTMMRDGVRKSRGFPYTSEGLQAAQDLVAKWEEDFSYDPPRLVQRRTRRSNLLTSEAAPHIARPGGGKQDSGQFHPSFEEEHTDIAYLPLTRGQEAIIDSTDVEKVIEYSWHATPHMMDGYYAATSIDGETTYLHRYLLAAPDGMYVDHINHNTLDNRRANLRLVSNQENNTNRNGAYRTSKTGIRGVSVHKCKPSGLMYTFRCHCVTCKIAKVFPYTEEGLEAAKAYAEAHYTAMYARKPE